MNCCLLAAFCPQLCCPWRQKTDQIRNAQELAPEQLLEKVIILLEFFCLSLQLCFKQTYLLAHDCHLTTAIHNTGPGPPLATLKQNKHINHQIRSLLFSKYLVITKEFQQHCLKGCPQSKNINIRLIKNYKFIIGVTAGVNGYATQSKGFVFSYDCTKLVTCQDCTPAFAIRQWRYRLRQPEVEEKQTYKMIWNDFPKCTHFTHKTVFPRLYCSLRK